MNTVLDKEIELPIVDDEPVSVIPAVRQLTNTEIDQLLAKARIRTDKLNERKRQIKSAIDKWFTKPKASRMQDELKAKRTHKLVVDGINILPYLRN